MADVSVETTRPLRLATSREAALIRQVLDRAGFTERSVCERLKLPTLESVDLPLFKSFMSRLAGAGALEPLARVFLFGEIVDAASFRAGMTDDELEAFTASDLIRVSGGTHPGASGVFSPVRLVPINPWDGANPDLLLAGDRADHPDGSKFVPFEDIVFTGHNPLTRQFVRLLPRTPCGDLLDLCAGTGVGALAMSPFADRCTAADVAERSVHFARFNGWLNQSSRLEILCGDLYEPIANRRFDRIVAHPPYVPALTQKLTYRDGGKTGDEIAQRIIAGAPGHLNEGGTFHVLFLAMDTADGSIEERARGWLGDAAREFDIIFALDSRTPPELIATRLVERAGGSSEDLERWRELFQGIRVREFVYGALVGRRFTSRGEGEAFTRRVMLSDHTTGEAFDRLFQWFDWLRLPDRENRVLGMTPTLPADLHLEVRHTVEHRTFAPSGYALSNGGKPFFTRLETEAWVAAFLSEFDGERTVRDHYRSASDRGRVPKDFSEADLARLMCFLAERGCVLLDKRF